MEKLMEKCYAEMLADGSIEAIIKKEIKDMVDRACSSAFSYGSPIYKEMQAKVNEVIAPAIQNSDFSKYVAAFTAVVNASLENTAAGPYKAVCDGLVSLLGSNEKMPEKVKLTDIYKAWCEHLESETVSRDDVDSGYLEGDTYIVHTRMTAEGSGGVMFKSYKVTFEVDDTTLNEYCDLHDKKFEFNIYGDTISLNNYSLRDLKFLNKFEAYLIKLHNSFCSVEVDTESDEADVEVDVE